MTVRNIQILACCGALAILATSCSVPKDVAYFQNSESITAVLNEQPIIVRPGDKLNIVIKSKDPAISDLFNLPLYTTRVGQNTTATGEGVRNYSASSQDGTLLYTVSPAGTIDFPMLGNLKVSGMSRAELSGYIKGELMGRDLVKDPTVIVEFVGTGVNVIGEVNTPGRYDINKDKFNILEAISVAGDLTIKGLRNNVKVIREEDGQMKTYTVDLTNLSEAVKSPGFYLRQNDVVYVEPNDMRKRETTVNGNNAYSTSFWISVASLITTAVTTVGVFLNK